MISVIIPARNEPYLHKTIADILAKSENTEVIAVLDGYWPDASKINMDERVHYLHYSISQGMRHAINRAVDIAQGDYILKTDAHCLFAPSFDLRLLMDIDDKTVLVPRRKRLDPEKWEVIEDGRPPVDYEYLDSKDLHGVRWEERAKERQDFSLDPIISAQGSCWMMSKDLYRELNLLDEEQFGRFFLEFQEISFKAWFNGYKVLVDKSTWYAHWHKTDGRGYSLDNDREKAVKGIRDYCNSHKEQFNNLIKQFMPMPGWKT